MLLYVPGALPGRAKLERAPGRHRSFALRFMVMDSDDNPGPGLAGVVREVPVAATWSREFALGALALAFAAASGAVLPGATHDRAYGFVAVALALAGLVLIAIARFEPVRPDASSLAETILELRSARQTDFANSTADTEATAEASLWRLAREDQRFGAGALARPLQALRRSVTALKEACPGARRAERYLRIVAIAGSIAAGLTGVVLVMSVSSQSFWTTFGRIATILAVLAFLLALPALSLAYRTERIVDERLPDERNLKVVPRPDERGPEATVRSDTQGVLVGELARPPSASLDPLRRWLLLSDPESAVDESCIDGALSRYALEAAIAASAGSRALRRLLNGTAVYALGEPTGDTSVPGHGTESDLLHFEIDENDETSVMLPVFTNADDLRAALKRNEDWQSLKVLEIDGGALLRARDPDVSVVVNPWSETTEFQVPPRVRSRRKANA
jgi:hypothetical protein